MGKRQARNVGTFFNSLLLYPMKSIPARDQPVLATIMTYVDNNHHSEELFISATTVYLCQELTEGNQSIYKNLPCLPVNF